MDVDKLIDLGKKTKEIKSFAKSLVKPGAKLLDIAENIEKRVEGMGLMMAFPVNISINDVAAHYTPTINDESVVDENDIVTVDFGLWNGVEITDTSFTLDLSGEHSDLVETSEAALNRAIEEIKPGVENGFIGGIIEETIRSRGFKPISNLTGHKIEPLNLHAGVSIPNIKTGERYVFKEGDVFAIEPFVTTRSGLGYVKETEIVEIYSFINKPPLRLKQSKDILNYIYDKFKTMPFAERWIRKIFHPQFAVSAALKELLKSHAIMGYPMLREANNQLVSQHEHTVYIDKDGPIVIT